MAKAIITYGRRGLMDRSLRGRHVAVGSSSTKARAFPSGRTSGSTARDLSSRREFAQCAKGDMRLCNNDH